MSHTISMTINDETDTYQSILVVSLAIICGVSEGVSSSIIVSGDDTFQKALVHLFAFALIHINYKVSMNDAFINVPLAQK